MRGTLGYTTLWRSGGQIPTVSRAQLAQFKNKTYRPQLLDLRLDTSGASTTALRDSKWNKAVVSELVKVTGRIIANTTDGRFGQTKIFALKQLYRDRFQKLYREIYEWRPRSGETEKQRGTRLAMRLIDRRKINKKINIRHLVSDFNADCLIHL